MPTITVFVADTEDQQRKRRRARRLAALIIFGIAAAFGFSRESTPIAKRSPRSPQGVIDVKPEPKPDVLPPDDFREYDTPIGPLPGPGAIVAPAILDFGERPLDSVGAAQLVTIRNDGGHPLDRVTTSITGPFAVTSGCIAPILPGSDCAAAVVFAPQVAGASSGELTIHAGEGRRIVRLVGRAAAPQIADDALDDADWDADADAEVPTDAAESGHPHHLCINPTSIRFVRSGLDTITLTNPDEAPIQVTSIRLSGSEGRPVRGYEIAGDVCVKTMAPGEQCRFTILASPLALSTGERINVEVIYDLAERQRMASTAVAIANAR